jgi:hypothetical protein
LWDAAATQTSAGAIDWAGAGAFSAPAGLIAAGSLIWHGDGALFADAVVPPGPGNFVAYAIVTIPEVGVVSNIIHRRSREADRAIAMFSRSLRDLGGVFAYQHAPPAGVYDPVTGGVVRGAFGPASDVPMILVSSAEAASDGQHLTYRREALIPAYIGVVPHMDDVVTADGRDWIITGEPEAHVVAGVPISYRVELSS